LLEYFAQVIAILIAAVESTGNQPGLSRN